MADHEPVANAVVLYRKNTTTARLYSLVVDSRFRGRGIAQALVDAVESAAARRGRRRVRLEVRCDNEAAIGLYQQFGYCFVHRLARFYEDGRDALRFERAFERAQKPTPLAA